MYTIKSISEEGIYYLSSNWRKNKALWVTQSEYKERMLFKSIKGAKQSLKSLLEVMSEYVEDKFSIVEWNGKEFKEVENLIIEVKMKQWKTNITIIENPYKIKKEI